jgi:hypothetical protein
MRDRMTKALWESRFS